MKPLDIIRNGITTENPTFALLLGMCPTLATTTSALNGMAMGLATMFVLICSNTVISLIKSLVPDAVRIPCFIVVIAGFVTIVQMLMQAFLPSLYAISIALGFTLALVVFAGIREQLSRTELPESMRGIPIALISAGILAMAFMGFSGMVKM